MKFSDVCSAVFEVGKKVYQKMWDYRDEIDRYKCQLERCSDSEIKRKLQGFTPMNFAAREIWQERMDSEQEHNNY